MKRTSSSSLLCLCCVSRSLALDLSPQKVGEAQRQSDRKDKDVQDTDEISSSILSQLLNIQVVEQAWHVALKW